MTERLEVRINAAMCDNCQVDFFKKNLSVCAQRNTATG